MTAVQKNSFDLLRLCAAALVLYSHQHALLGLAELELLGWTTFGGVGVSIFFFLSGLLVWSSWARDPDLKRFFIRRSLRIFPALWFVVLVTVLVLGPIFSNLTAADYFASFEAWRYLSTALLVVWRGLPGVFADNPFPLAVNGSLWTLPVEFLCYVSVALVGSISLVRRDGLMALSLVLVAQRVPWGSWVTDRLGDLSYGMYIFAFPVQQIVVELGRNRGWTFATHLSLSFVATSVLVYLSWHVLEKRALLFKPQRRVSA